MAYQNLEVRRGRDLDRYHRRTAERHAQGLCPNCGKRPAAPDASLCAPCTEQRREAERARYATGKSRELELVTDRAQNLGDRRDAFDRMRDLAADAYRAETGETWRRRHGSHGSQTGKLTSAAIDARGFLRTRKDRETRAHLPEGTLVAIAGGKNVSNPAAVIARLDKAKAKYDDIILCDGGGPGVESNGVHQVVCKPDWDRHGRAAPFRRNDELLNLLLKGVITFPGSGITDNLVDKAVKLGIPVHKVSA